MRREEPEDDEAAMPPARPPSRAYPLPPVEQPPSSSRNSSHAKGSSSSSSKPKQHEEDKHVEIKLSPEEMDQKIKAQEKRVPMTLSLASGVASSSDLKQSSDFAAVPLPDHVPAVPHPDDDKKRLQSKEINEERAIAAVTPGAVRVDGIDAHSESLHTRTDYSQDTIPSSELYISETQQEPPTEHLASAIQAELVPPQENLDAQIRSHVQNMLQKAPIANVQTVEVDGNNSNNNGGGRIKKRWILVGLGLLLAVGAIGGGVGAALAKKGDDGGPSPTPSPKPDQTEAMMSLLHPVSGDSLKDPNSPQSRALDWIATQDDAALVVGEADDETIKLRYAAAVLYYSLNGANWYRQLGFLSADDICAWNDQESGIICDTESNVDKIQFIDNRLSGTLPEEISVFTTLTQIDASTNQIKGDIPSEIGLLSDLEFLYLERNQLTSNIPTELINCRNLKEFWGFDNNMTGNVTPFLESLNDGLLGLSIGQNLLTGFVPTTIGRFTSLRNLEFFDSGLEGTLPTEIGLVGGTLTTLNFGWNLLDGSIPTEIGLCSLLNFLNLGNNNFTGIIPTELTELTKLERLLLYGNPLSGNVDPICDQGLDFELFAMNVCGEEKDFSCSCCTHCCERDNDNCNQATGEPQSTLEAFKNLLSSVSGDRLDDPSSPQTSALTWIVSEGSLVIGVSSEEEIKQRYAAAVLYYAMGGENWYRQLSFLSANDICAWKDGELGILCDTEGNVDKINLLDNGLTGSLPEEISVFLTLTQIDASTNQIGGQIPSEIGLLVDLEWLYLNENQLTGSIPTELISCQNLLEFWGFDNNMTGNVTPFLESLNDDLLGLALGQNLITGSIPSSIGRYTSLRNLEFFDGGLEGTLPTEIGLVGTLTSLGVAWNLLEGPIPSEIGLCNQLSFLNLGRNEFTGAIPEEISQLTKLESLLIYGNSLSGNVDPICTQGLEVFVTNVCGEPQDFNCSCCTHCCERENDNCEEVVS